jgi:hypothetical protein
VLTVSQDAQDSDEYAHLEQMPPQGHFPQEIHLAPLWFGQTDNLFDPIPVTEDAAARVGRAAVTRGGIMLHEVLYPPRFMCA